MPSFTSSSEVRTGSGVERRDIALLIALLAAIGLMFEFGTRFGVVRLSRITSRMHTEYKQAVEVKNGERTEVLLLGNSLLDAAVDAPRLQKALVPDIEVTRLMIEQTSYFDWYYGMRRLFDEGARPDVVVLCLSARHLISSAVRDDFFAHYMMKATDLPSVAANLDLHPTQAMNMLFANASHFYGMRSEIRKVVMGRLMPGTKPLMALITRVDNRPLTDDEVRTGALARLREYKEVAHRYGSEFVFLMPPLVGNDRSEIVAEAGAALNVPVVALPPGRFKRADFSDGYHLSPRAAVTYTEEIIPRLRNVIAGVKNDRPAAAAGRF
jgi:hypothetical protein